MPSSEQLLTIMFTPELNLPKAPLARRPFLFQEEILDFYPPSFYD